MLLDTTRSKHCLIDNVRPIGSSNHKDHSPVINSVQLIQKSIDYSFSDLIALVLPFGSKSIELIKKNNARS
jgi:hypothetical protein